MTDQNPLSVVPTNWQDLLETLFPSGERTITDIAGNVYTIRTVLSAKRETELLRVLSKASEISTDVGLSSGGTKSTQETISNLLGTIVKMANDPRVLNLLDEAFTLVFRPIVDRSIASIRGSDSESYLLDGIENPQAIDCFDTMEMIQALIPFAGKAARKLAAVLKSMKTVSSPLAN